MRTTFLHQKLNETGSALMITMIMTGVALAVLAGAMTWSANTTRQTHRAIEYTRAVAAAEGATEKALSKISQDFLLGGEALVTANLTGYRQAVPNTSDSASWGRWQFNDASGHSGQNFVRHVIGNRYIVLNSTYAGLRGYASTCTVAAHARDTAALESVEGGVVQEIQLARIPIFQFAMYSSGNMEISCGQPLTITGRVHSNGYLYVEPDDILTFQSDVTAVNDILFQRHPLDTRGDPDGSAVYQGRKDSHVAALTLPIGYTNTPVGIREIIHPPPSGEDANSPIGRLRYYNLADMIITVSNTAIHATSGLKVNSFSTVVPTNEVTRFVRTSQSFYDEREGKTVRPIGIDIAQFKEWSRTNSNVRTALDSLDVASIYVVDRRTLSGTDLGAVRVYNGRQLPSRGLTVATARPLYVQGHYNQPTPGHLGTAHTQTTQPASLVGDAITILSENWSDARSTSGLDERSAAPTTVNAALLTGAVSTTASHYSGGMENFPRFLESWGEDNVFTYNGSMVKMFPSLYATNYWRTTGVYGPPKRNWAYDRSYDDPNKLPPLTPSLLKVLRGQWAVVGANRNTVPTVH